MEQIFIGTLAHNAGVPVKTIRYYEEQGLLPKAPRTESRYRIYTPDISDRLQFIKKAQFLGLQLKDIKEILDVADRGCCPCGHVQKTLRSYLVDLRQKIQDFKLLEKRIRVAMNRTCPPSFKPRGKAICPTIQEEYISIMKGGEKQ